MNNLLPSNKVHIAARYSSILIILNRVKFSNARQLFLSFQELAVRDSEFNEFFEGYLTTGSPYTLLRIIAPIFGDYANNSTFKKSIDDIHHAFMETDNQLPAKAS